MFKKSFFVVALLMSAATLPAYADDTTDRMDALEQQVRQLVGQMEELNYTIKQMQGQISAAPQQSGEAVPKPVVPIKKKLALATPIKPEISGQVSDTGVETIQEAPLAQADTLYDDAGNGTAPAPKALGALANKASQAGDGGFEGQVLVAPGEAAIGEAATVQDAPVQDTAAAVEQVSLQPETPDELFMRSEKSLLQLQYGDAESGFKDFLAKYPDHNLAGSAQFKLGETFYAQQNYADAAQNYLTGYKQFPKSRRAADSLLKLGLSLNKLGQKEQGCAALGSVGNEFPKAVEANKRAQTEFKRAGC